MKRTKGKGLIVPMKPLSRSSIEAYIGIIIGVVLAVHPPSQVWATVVCWLFVLGLAISAIYRSEWTRKARGRAKTAMVIIAVSVAGFCLWKTLPRPSYLFLVPGVRLGTNQWDLIVTHRGPEPLYQVQMLLEDMDYLAAARAGSASATGSRQDQTVSIAEVDPAGRGSSFAKQILWTPFNQERSRLHVDITSRDRDYGEDIYIDLIGGTHWVTAIQLRDRSTSKLIFTCKDDLFPPAQVEVAGKACFPEDLKTE